MNDAQRYYDALRRIAHDYASPEELRRTAERRYWLNGDEAIAMAYENVMEEARVAIHRKRRPKERGLIMRVQIRMRQYRFTNYALDRDKVETRYYVCAYGTRRSILGRGHWLTEDAAARSARSVGHEVVGYHFDDTVPA